MSQILAVGSTDPILHHLAPLALAAAAAGGTAVVVDLDPDAPPLPGRLDVATLLHQGPSSRELPSGRRGVAVLPHGGVRAEAGLELVQQLQRAWPSVVVRIGDVASPGSMPAVPVLPILPEALDVTASVRAAHQPTAFVRTHRRRPGVVLPPVRSSTVRAMLAGRIDRRWRWIRGWRSVWETSWE